MALFAEMRRRNVFKVALLYAVASWLIVWFVEAIQSEVTLPGWTEMFTYFVLVVGYPVALWFAWTYEITPVGLKKASDVDQTQSIVYKTGQKLNSAVAVLLVLGVLAVFGQRLLPKFEFLVPGIPQGDAPASEKAPPHIRSHTLSNGLKVIVWPDNDTPIVTMYNYVRAGSRNESPGITGLAHFFEHQMFGATENREFGELQREIEAAGGSNNAYTSPDVTVFMEWFPSSALETVFDLEGDRFQNLILAEEPFERERGAVASERRMRIDNSNFGTLAEQVRATAFVAHPYQSSGIGWPSDIESWTVEDALDFYATYYAPNNRTVVVVGDVTPEGVFELAERYFAGVPAREPPPIVRTVEPEQRGERRVRVEASAQTPMVMVAFHSGTASDPETLHLSLLSDILTDGDSSRLHRTLVEEEGVALSVRSYVHKGFDPGLTWFLLTLPPDSDPDAAEQRLVEELQRVVDDGVTVAELDKARNKMLAWYWGELETIDGRAGLVGDYDVFHGTFEAMFEVPAALEAVTVEHLRDAATAVIHEDNMTVGVLISPDDEGE